MREEEEVLRKAESTLKDYVSKWAVRTVELNLDFDDSKIKSARSPNAAGGDG